MKDEYTCNPNEISHSGIVRHSDEHSHYILITSTSACAGCHARGACHLGDFAEKVIEISRKGKEEHYEPGRRVKVVMEQKLGLQAVFLGYILPFIILLTTLIVASALTGSEGLSALLSLLVLVPYYVILYRFRDRLRKRFEFRIADGSADQ